MEEAKVKLLDKTITLYSWSKPSLDCIVQMANGDTFADGMLSCEEWLAKSQGATPLPEAQAALNHHECQLYLAAVKSTPLYKLIQSEPLFSTASPVLVATFAQFADVRPDPETILRTRDTTFMRILRTISQKGFVSDKDLLREDLTKLIAFDTQQPVIVGHLREIAFTLEWRPQLLSLEADLENPKSLEGAPAGLSDAANAIRELLRNHADDPEPMNLLKRFLAPPQFSAMLREEVLAYWEIRGDLPSAESLLKKEFFDSASSDGKYQKIAAATVDLLPAQWWKDIELGFCVRQEAIQAFLSLRRFAKLDALEKQWPALAQQLNIDGSALLKTLERTIIEPESASKETTGNLRQYLQDGQLVRFLKLRPLFRDIYPQDIKKQYEVSQIVAKTAVETETAFQGATAISKPPYEDAESQYENLFVTITSDPTNAEHYNVEVRADSSNEQANVHASLSDLAGIKKSLAEAVVYRQRTRDVLLVTPRAADTATQLKELGTRLWKMFFPKHVGDLFSATLDAEPKRRIVLDLEDANLRQLPWECLYVPRLRAFVALVKKCSIIRRLPNARSLISHTLSPPLRILMVISQPEDALYLDIDQERTALSKAVAGAIEDGRVELQVLEHATRSELQHYLRVFKPHLFHFVGHGTYSEDEKQGALVFEDEEHKSMMVSADDLKTLLVDNNINLAVLNSCDTGTTGTNEVVTGVAGALVEHGIPAAIATLRPVFDAAALLFTREFYSSLADGYALESAIIEARKALSIEKWDWPAYALFSGITELDSFRLIKKREVRGNDRSN